MMILMILTMKSNHTLEIECVSSSHSCGTPSFYPSLSLSSVCVGDMISDVCSARPVQEGHKAQKPLASFKFSERCRLRVC